jgi:hypothetical protein
MLPLAAPLTGTHPTGRDATVAGFTRLTIRYSRAGCGDGLRAHGYAQTARVLAGVVLLDIGGAREVMRCGAEAYLPARALYSLVPLAAGTVVAWEPADAR